MSTNKEFDDLSNALTELRASLYMAELEMTKLRDALQTLSDNAKKRLKLMPNIPPDNNEN